METSLRYGGDSKAIRIHAKENFPLATNKHFQVHAALDTGSGNLSYFSGIIRNFYPELSTTLDVGLQYDKRDKFRYTFRGKKEFPITSNGLLNFVIKGRYDAFEEFKEKRPRGAAELSWSKFNFREDQDVRFKVGYEVFNKSFSLAVLKVTNAPLFLFAFMFSGRGEYGFVRLSIHGSHLPEEILQALALQKVPYFQIRENNWTLNADMKGGWNVRFDL